MKIPQETIDSIKTNSDLVSCIRQYVKLDKTGKVYTGLCPFHPDTKRSLFVDPAKQLWNCLGACSANGSGKSSGGDILSFVMKYHGVTFREAVQRLAPPKPITISQDVRCKAPAILSLVIDAYCRSYQESRTAQEYISSRGLDPALAKQYKAGYVDGSLLDRVSRDSADWKLLQEIGIITEHGNEHFRTCVVFPLTAFNQFTVNVYGRAVSTDQHLYLPGPRRGLFNWTVAKNYEELILTESIIDALSFIQAGYHNTLPIYGINGFTQDHMDFIVRFRARKVILALDSDEAGAKAAAHIAEKIGKVHIPTQIIELPAKDANELLKKEGVEKFKAIVAELLKKEIVAGSSTNTVVESAKPEGTTPIAYTRGEAEGELMLTIQDRRYGLRAVPKKTYSQMRVAVELTVGDSKYLDSVDLLSARARSGFASRCTAHFHIPNPILERDLYLLLEAVDRYQKEQVEGAKPEKVEITEIDKEEALTFLKSPDLLDQVVADMGELGYVGEEHNKKLGYLIAVSRKLAEPLSAVILSQSGSGKSFLAEVLELLTPKEEMKMFSRLTPKALYYMEKDALVHKFVIVEERSGSEEADYSIRTMQSKKKLILAAVMKDPSTGKMATKEFEIYGPTAFLETTTSPRINHENSTRCFEMYLDESAEQTGRIHTMQRILKTSIGRDKQSEWEQIRKKHHNAQRLLRPVLIHINYATILEFPKNWLRTRRDNLRFLNLIEVTAFLHQYQKEVKTDKQGREYIEADLRDYEVACKLAERVLPDTLSEIKKPVADLLSSIETYTGQLANQQNLSRNEVAFSRREIRDYTGLPNHRIKELFKELEELEYVEVEKSQRGGSYCYRLVSGSVESKLSAFLLTAEQLKERLNEKRKEPEPSRC
jgi:DNA primase